MINVLQDAVSAIREVKLGIRKEDIGMHLIRFGAAIAMYIGDCPVSMIMLIGRWLSDAFLRLICKQVMEFSQNVAKKMLSYQNISGTSPTSTQEFIQRILVSKINQTMPRREGMLVVTRSVVSGFPRSLNTIE